MKNNNAQRIHERKMREAQNPFARLASTCAASRKQSQQILQSIGDLSIVEWRILWDLIEAGPLTIRELTEIQRNDHSLLSRALPHMKKKRLVSMQRDTDDGRQIIVEISDLGHKAYERAAPTMKRRREALNAVYTPQEIVTFIDFIDRLDQFLNLPIDTFLEEKDRD